METWKHILRSQFLFDEPAAEVHYWIDQFWADPEGDDCDMGRHKHRAAIHNKAGEKGCVLEFGEWARKHFVQHMKDDGIEEYL